MRPYIGTVLRSKQLPQSVLTDCQFDLQNKCQGNVIETIVIPESVFENVACSVMAILVKAQW